MLFFLLDCQASVADLKILKSGGWWKTIYHPRPQLSQMHAMIYRPFIRKKTAVWGKIEPIMGRAASTAPAESATAKHFA